MMRIQVSVEIMAGMLVALSLALFVTALACGASGALSKNAHAISDAALAAGSGLNEMRGVCGSTCRGGLG
ncbi:Uncharacterised protein [uncultured archaeon]|nr:Uncharacterised protein [uncultured archaeon]